MLKLSSNRHRKLRYVLHIFSRIFDKLYNENQKLKKMSR